MHGLWLADIESLEAVSQDEDARAICVRMAAMSNRGGLEPFLDELALDRDLDEDTKATLTELATNAPFLFALEDYVRATSALH